ncbi:DNA alkylation repair enzyme [Kordia periserrulae]|uniref:DNA alkylation repair enzyme n=1 Tax=Kordia periserrulae TaxID=701523 RepID=A0A2T6BQS2_9FLAO|nr:DNA alkylation repair protein [Kordia periserrulae]PTX58394.1 DNA alkylation repair enzyme [Kordia periserrulae]
MNVITKKSTVREILKKCFIHYHQDGLHKLITEIHDAILSHKVTFPNLEFCAETVFETLPENQHLPFCDAIHRLKTEGGNVLLGKILQKRLPFDYTQSIEKATEYIADADIWYVCDIIGERVYGYALLHEPQRTIQEIKRLSKHKTNWVLRALGAGTHYAIKKGLEKSHVKNMFTILLSFANAKDKEVRQGIGWAAKTTAKFHPDIIALYSADIKHPENTAYWFRKKIEIGLNRNAYAKKN